MFSFLPESTWSNGHSITSATHLPESTCTMTRREGPFSFASPVNKRLQPASSRLRLRQVCRTKSSWQGTLAPLRLKFTREQNYASHKIPTKTELSLSN